MKDPDLQSSRALVIDANPTSRSTLVGMLRDVGVGLVTQCSRALDARRILETRSFDVVVCEHHFDHQAMGGQDLLDDLRRAQLLPLSTVFIMVTSEASYAKVAEAAEAALDSYLLKPHNAAALHERVLQARRRKLLLKPIFDAIEAGDLDTAAALCLQRFEARGEYWLYAARVGAELLLRAGRHDAARDLFTAIREARALPWAKLGIARAEIEGGNTMQARRTLESLISGNPSFADAYDVMGRVQVEQGDLAGALETYRRASSITPASITRLQKHGMLCFYSGEWAEAGKSLERAMVTGLSSKMFDAQTLVLLALIRFDQNDPRGLVRVADNLGRALEKHPESRRLHRMHGVVTVLRTLGERQIARVIEQVRELAAGLRDEDFDFEAACNMVALLNRLGRTEVQLTDADDWLRTLARRFCVSKAGTELLCANALGHDTYGPLIHEAHAQVFSLAERAMTHSVKGSPAAAVQALIQQGQETLNAKLIELAGMVLQRYRDRIPAHAELSERATGLLQRYCVKGTRVNLNETGRSAGAMALRLPDAAGAPAPARPPLWEEPTEGAAPPDAPAGKATSPLAA